MTTPSTSSTSAAVEPPPYRKLINVNECYIRWAEQQPHQNDLSFACDAPRQNPWSAAAIPSSSSCGYHYATTGRCFDSRIRQLWYRSLIQLTKCTHQSDITAQATVSPGRVSLFSKMNATSFLVLF
uniref:Uncharacterized protein n=1 Tax=Romanomermis culicivorax TaxID=13658 RepID=A0A915IR32_ROMCU